MDEQIITQSRKGEFKHKTFEERLAEFNGEITVSVFDWGEPMGREECDLDEETEDNV